MVTYITKTRESSKATVTQQHKNNDKMACGDKSKS
ncbi:hypothetical protein CCACVL1_23737 [Corchorus capsularis]|uniref:Uncharacterized protein n=1 Tax=Corchorus capsularis TaxID=210143 RepID=A0A1R3GSL3_COCAP|nr:hypothetical protein CCACVL1_23737 [Corchorus capsularis]